MHKCRQTNILPPGWDSVLIIRSVAAKYSPRAVDGSKIAPVAPCAWPPKSPHEPQLSWGVHRRMRSNLDRPKPRQPQPINSPNYLSYVKGQNTLSRTWCRALSAQRSERKIRQLRKQAKHLGFDLVLQTSIIHKKTEETMKRNEKRDVSFSSDSFIDAFGVIEMAIIR